MYIVHMYVMNGNIQLKGHVCTALAPTTPEIALWIFSVTVYAIGMYNIPTGYCTCTSVYTCTSQSAVQAIWWENRRNDRS